MKKVQAIEAAAQGVLGVGERITSRGICWAAQAPPRKPLLFLARRQYLLVLTDRRLLVFRRRRGAPSASDLVIVKRYEAFTLQRVARSRPLMQVRLLFANGNRFVFEFRPRHRELGGELVARLTPRSDNGWADPGNDRADHPSPDDTAVAGAPARQPGPATRWKLASEPDDAASGDPESDGPADSLPPAPPDAPNST